MRWDYVAMFVSFVVAAFLLFACSDRGPSSNDATATPVDPESPSAVPEFEAPPGATLVIPGRAPVDGGIGTYCWDGFCRDLAGPVTNAAPIPMAGDGPFEIDFEHGDPDQVQLTWFEAPGTAPQLQNGFLPWSISPATGERLDGFEAMPEPGLHLLSVFAVWEGEGDVTYGWYVEVE
jgi:hypothetical protein